MIYVDSNHRCHVANDGTMTPLDVDYFDGKCDTFIEGYCCEIQENGISVYPWKDYRMLEGAQAEYEKNRAEMEDMKAALALLGVTVDE